MSPNIRRVERPEADPSGFESMVSLYQADIAVRDPDDPPPSEAEIAYELFGLNPDQDGLVLAADIDGETVAMAWAKTESEPGDELQVVYADILVGEEDRRRGVGTALACAMIPALQEMGQHSVLGFPSDDIEPEAGRALCRRFGLTERQVERCSRALVGDVDTALLAGWEADAATSAPGYRLEQWEGVCPDELAEAWSAAAAGMEDAPLDDIEHNPFTRDTAAQRAADDLQVAAGFRIYRSLVLSAEGDPAGLSAIFVHGDRPEVAYQDDTAVLAAHRGHRIGRWLKAANYRQVERAHPELVVVETYNAESNPWMLDINVEMGFRPHRHYAVFQGSLDEAARRL